MTVFVTLHNQLYTQKTEFSNHIMSTLDEGLRNTRRDEENSFAAQNILIRPNPYFEYVCKDIKNYPEYAPYSVKLYVHCTGCNFIPYTFYN